MKFQLILAALMGTALTQNGYNPGGSGAVTLPTTPSGSSTSDSTGGSGGSVNIVVPSFPKADLSIFNRGSTSPQVTSQNIGSTIGNARQQLSTPVRSIESLFTRLPSKQELDKFANDGDTAGILKTLTALASDDSVPCGTKVSYLLELLGSVKDAIRRKNLAADELTAIIDGAKAEIARLTDEIARIQKERDALGIPDLENKINDYVTRLQTLYNQINAVKAQIPPEEARIAGFQKEISTLTKQNDDERNRISNDKLKLTQTDNLIKDLEARLKDARDQKAALEASIAASEALIKDNNAKIANIRTTIAEIQAKIKNLQDTIDRLRRDANTLEVDLERARTNLSVAQVQDRNFADDIRNLQNRIKDEEPKLVDDDLRKLKSLIDKLNKTIPSIQSEIDREYYYCYGAGKVDTQQVGNVIVYVIKGEAFGHYIDTAYGQAVGAPQLRTGADYRLQLVDPFSQIWTAKYGYPSLAGSNGATGGNFSCISGTAPSTGSGVISGVSGNGIQVKDSKGNLVSLNVGGCSRVESTASVPMAGQAVVWKGVPSSNGGYNILTATCYDR